MLQQIVVEDSATLGLPTTNEILILIDENHSNICKFADQDHDAYQLVRARITTMIEDGITKRRLQSQSPTQNRATLGISSSDEPVSTWQHSRQADTI
jgi:hypothetical protein